MLRVIFSLRAFATIYVFTYTLFVYTSAYILYTCIHGSRNVRIVRFCCSMLRDPTSSRHTSDRAHVTLANDGAAWCTTDEKFAWILRENQKFNAQVQYARVNEPWRMPQKLVPICKLWPQKFVERIFRYSVKYLTTILGNQWWTYKVL